MYQLNILQTLPYIPTQTPVTIYIALSPSPTPSKMPPSRRKPSNTTTGARAQQTLAFGPTPNKITKASLPPTTANSKKKPHPPTDTARLQKALSDKLPTTPSEEKEEEEEEANDDEPPRPPEEQEDAQSAKTNLTIRPPAEAEAKTDDLKKQKTRSETMEGKGSPVSEAQIRRYWQGKEEERIAPRVHQTGLSVEEKVLRHFDLSTQYGVRPFFLFPSTYYSIPYPCPFLALNPKTVN